MIVLKQFQRFPNAGDMASAVLIGRLLGEEIRLAGPEPLSAPHLVGIGSILHWADRYSTIWGTGFVSADAHPSAAPARILAVRGPLTAARLNALGISTPALVGDPGILAPALFPPPGVPPSGIAVVPHYVDADAPFVERAREHGVSIIDPLSPLESYLMALASAEVVISSSLHGVIFAHAYGRRAIWVKLSERVIGGGFKFFDYFASIGYPRPEVPILTGREGLDEAVDRAVSPRISLDRQALREVLLSVVDDLGGASAPIVER
jgi:pyruvyltransferase